MPIGCALTLSALGASANKIAGSAQHNSARRFGASRTGEFG
jgi:hypothetical protein